MITGFNAEELFKEVMKDHEVKPSTKDENMFDHIDFFVDGESYDVKSHKKHNRSDEDASDTIWLETVNVRGDKGWLYGKAKYIAFIVSDEFWIVPRISLVNYVEANIPDKVYKFKRYKKWYQRAGRKDCITYVYPRDIDKMVVKKLKITK